MVSPIETNLDSQSTPMPPRPGFQFSLKDLFWLMVIVGILAAGASLLGIVGFVLACFTISVASWIGARIRGKRRVSDIWGAITMCAFLLVIVIVPLLLPEVGSHPASPRVQCINNLKQLALALLDYQDKYGSFPPQYTTDQSGTPLMSWRTAILPFLEQAQLYSKYHANEPWDSAANKPLSQIQLLVFQCPVDDGPTRGPRDTSYVAITGPWTVWGIGTGVKLASIKDGLSDTLVLFEMKNSGIVWSEPRDLDLNHLPPGLTPQNLLKSLSNYAGGFNAVFADGHVEFIPWTIPWSQFVALTTIDGGEKIDRSTWGP